MSSRLAHLLVKLADLQIWGGRVFHSCHRHPMVGTSRLTVWMCIIWVAVCIQGEVELGVVQAQRSAAKALCPELGRYAVQRQHIPLHLRTARDTSLCYPRTKRLLTS